MPGSIWGGADKPKESCNEPWLAQPVGQRKSNQSLFTRYPTTPYQRVKWVSREIRFRYV